MRFAVFLSLAAAPITSGILAPVLSKDMLPKDAGRQRAAAPVIRTLSSISWAIWCVRNERLPLRLGQDVEVRPTGDVRGQGLFAMRDLDPGVLIERYTGKWIPDDEFTNSDLDGAYAFGLTNGYTIDGVDPKRSSYVRYINHSVRKANCEGVQAFEENELIGTVYLQTIRTIEAGEELLFDYGAEYWDERAWRFTPQRFMIDNL